MSTVSPVLRLFDAHCHVAEDPRCVQDLADPVRYEIVPGDSRDSAPSGNALRTSRQQIHVARLALMGTRGSDWTTVHELASGFPTLVVPAFGLHPWFAHHVEARTDDDEWQRRLRDLLSSQCNAIIGECGVDKLAVVLEQTRYPEADDRYGEADDRYGDAKTAAAPSIGANTFETHQREVFEWQYRLSVELQRPLCIHVVAAHGYIAEFFRDIVKRMPSKRQLRKHREEFKRDKIIGTDGDNEEPHSKQEEQVLSPMEQASRQHLPPRILMHSYAGSRDSMLQLLRLPNLGPRLYFSFSQFVHARMKREHALDIIRTCPRERLLIESDMHRVADVGRAMAEVLLFVSEAREWTLEETAHVTWENACRFYEVSG